MPWSLRLQAELVGATVYCHEADRDQRLKKAIEGVESVSTTSGHCPPSLDILMSMPLSGAKCLIQYNAALR
jgi:hypothetical protein